MRGEERNRAYRIEVFVCERVHIYICVCEFVCVYNTTIIKFVKVYNIDATDTNIVDRIILVFTAYAPYIVATKHRHTVTTLCR